MLKKPIVLAGFMATGKSTVGKILAHNLGWRFVDLDKLIEQREGKTTAQIFSEQGEEYFRQLESSLLQQVLEVDAPEAYDLVLAVGGGAVLNPSNRARLLARACVICLRASTDEILKRVGDLSTRPMLAGENPRARIEQLLHDRAPAYASLHFHIDTTNQGPVDSARMLEQLLKRQVAQIHVSVPVVADDPARKQHYDIHIGIDSLDDLGELLLGRQLSSPLAIITDSNLTQKYARRVTDSLTRVGLKAFVCEMRAGEPFKNLKTVELLYGELARRGLERGGAIIALGGGVVGDTAGYIAATWLRGVKFVQVPTSLLAMADSSIGGKVGVDAPFGKNLIGAFKQPELVLMDLALLRTLPADELACGWSEIIKAGLISGCMAGLHEDLQASKQDPMTVLPSLMSAIEMKRDIVQQDPFEQNKRTWLNLGHTFGHGIEFWSGFKIKHGQAVALGLLCALKLSHKMKLCNDDVYWQTQRLLRLAKLPLHLNELPAISNLTFNVDQVWSAMQNDKKRSNGRLRFVLIRKPGDVFLSSDYDEVDAKEALASIAR